MSSTPRISKTFTPGRDFAIAPVIGCVEPRLIFDLVPHSSVFVLSTSLSRIAIIVFQIGDNLVGSQERNVVLLVVVASWVSPTSLVS